MNKNITPNIKDIFNQDITKNSGYLYTTNAQLSSRMANRRLTDATLVIADWRGKQVLDIGCGDGTYTLELFNYGQPDSVHGIDPAQEAIKLARQKITERHQITFAVEDAYKLPYQSNAFDIAYLRGVLHHMERPSDALQEALRVAPMVVVIEPNGYSPILKLLERFSSYHIEHGEKSYPATKLDQWVRRAGGTVQKRQWVGLVPMFCPDWLAHGLKLVEPIIESIPLLKTVGCAVYVFAAVRKDPK